MTQITFPTVGAVEQLACRDFDVIWFVCFFSFSEPLVSSFSRARPGTTRLDGRRSSSGSSLTSAISPSAARGRCEGLGEGAGAGGRGQGRAGGGRGGREGAGGRGEGRNERAQEGKGWKWSRLFPALHLPSQFIEHGEAGVTASYEGIASHIETKDSVR
jgi:hypothetical protein